MVDLVWGLRACPDLCCLLDCLNCSGCLTCFLAVFCLRGGRGEGAEGVECSSAGSLREIVREN